MKEEKVEEAEARKRKLSETSVGETTVAAGDVTMDSVADTSIIKKEKKKKKKDKKEKDEAAVEENGNGETETAPVAEAAEVRFSIHSLRLVSSQMINLMKVVDWWPLRTNIINDAAQILNDWGYQNAGFKFLGLISQETSTKKKKKKRKEETAEAEWVFFFCFSFSYFDQCENTLNLIFMLKISFFL